MKSSVITAFLTHQGPREVRRMLDYWAEHQPGLNAVVAYGGSRQHFDELVSAGVDALYIDDPRLRTQDHPSKSDDGCTQSLLLTTLHGFVQPLPRSTPSSRPCPRSQQTTLQNSHRNPE